MPKRASAELTKRRVEAASPGQWLWDGGARGIPGFGLRVTPGGSRTFLYRYRTSAGEQRWAKLGGFPALTVDEARDLAKARAGEVAKGGNPSGDRQRFREAPTLTDLANHYLGAYANERRLKPNTVRDARNLLSRPLAELGRRKVAELTVADIRRLHGAAKVRGLAESKAKAEALAKAAGKADGAKAERLEARAKRAADHAAAQAGSYQANRLHAVLSKMFSLAIELGWRTDNPCKGVRKFEEDQRNRNLSEAEVARLLDACDAYEGEHAGAVTARGAADAVRLLLYTGARLQEVLRADWGQFDLERGLWEKPSAHTKTKRQHLVELDGPALHLLRDMRERDPSGRFLFPGESGKGRVAKLAEVKPRADLKRPWAWLVREAGLRNVRLHDLRRTNASFMLSSGFTLATVGNRLGHTQPSTTARYAHLHDTVGREAGRVVGERMAALRGTSSKAEVVALGKGASQ